jgi:biopolymer transport protein TolR
VKKVMHKNRRITKTLSEINVTPFVDVMLVLLVIFMVTTPLMDKEIEVNLPQAEGKDVDKLPTGIITFKKNKRLYYNDKRVHIEELGDFLKKTYQGRQNEEVFLKADQELSYAEVIKIMEIVKQAGIEKLGMITEPQER